MACYIAYLPINCGRVMDSCANLSLLYRSFTKSAVNPFVARFSDGHATLCRKRVYQINHSSYTHKTIY